MVYWQERTEDGYWDIPTQNGVRNGKETNAIFMHLQGNNNHLIEWEVSYLDCKEDWKKEKSKKPFTSNLWTLKNS